MTIGPDVDPLSYALAPPAGETPAERDARIQAERDAKKRSDLIDQELNRQRAADKKADKPVKILLLGQSESGVLLAVSPCPCSLPARQIHHPQE